MLSVIMLNVTYKPFVLSVVWLSVVRLNVVRLNVVAPSLHCAFLSWQKNSQTLSEKLDSKNF